jgi:hypothetical protein
MEKIVLKVAYLTLLSMIYTGAATVDPAFTAPVDTKYIKQRLLSIKRNVSNLEQVLRKNKTVEAFYRSPQALAQLEELSGHARALMPGKQGEAHD